MVVAPLQLKMDAPPPTASVTVSAPGAARLRLWCSAGELSRAVALGDDKYGATYTPPPGGKPSYVVVATWDEESGEAATVTLALAARSEIPVETDPGAQVLVMVHGRRSTARANAAGHARVLAWVWPGETVATVTATDAAGNATTHDVALETARADALFVVAPVQVVAGEPVRVYAFSAGAVVPRLAISTGALSGVRERPGVGSALLATASEVTVVAVAGEERALERVRVGRATVAAERSIALASIEDADPAASKAPTSETGVATGALPPLSAWELGAAVGGRYGGSLAGIVAVVEARRRLGRFAVGLNLDGRWATGAIGAEAVTLGGIGLDAVGEARLPVAPRVALYLAASLGGHYARVSRTPPSGKAKAGNDGGPTLGGAAGLVWRVGPGLVDVALGFAWSPLVGSGRVNADGAGLTVGYRAARWRRRAGRTRRAHRRRRGRDR